MALLLLLFLVKSLAIDHQCNNIHAKFPRCTNNSVINITKSTDRYQVTLLITEWQCYNDFCLLNDKKYRQKDITCNDTCGACQRLRPPGGNDCGTEVTNCEVSVDTYLDDFCAQATSTRNKATICTSTTITEELPCPTSTITVHSVQQTTVTVPASPEVSPTLPCQYNNMTDPTTSVTPQTYIPSLAPQTLTKSVVSVTALGALLVLSLLLLTMVTTGWVCTYISMTKREAKKNSTHTRVTDLDDDDDDKTNEERLFHNPIYDDTHTSIIQPHETKPTLGPTGSLINDENFPETTYDCINLPAQPAADNGQTYDVLNRSQANGNSSAPVLVVERLYNNEDYSQLALQDK